jgi:threonine synthase
MMKKHWLSLKMYENYSHLLDPHAAVAYAAMEKYFEDNPKKALFWELLIP